ncbi:glycoside hydrolase family 3 C-terminal domain-containing protein [Lentzea sp. NPDC005914]|uniref:glycoside hydrolase family 3 C-terminal domain-containing protein n=1 Tax=Lentzea sp. NPDC005914 TaxID=3154572 RepID=UPI0033FC647C
MRGTTRIAAAAVLLASALVTAPPAAQAEPLWLQPNQPLEQRVNALLEQLTVDEEATLLHGILEPPGERVVGYVAGIPRLDIPPLRLTDGPAGVRDGAEATAFPAPVALAASFDRGLNAEAGAVMGRETKARGYQVLYAPMINIVRVPQAGRNFESYGEDPHLAGVLGASFVEGVQSQKVAAQVKHFAANNQEKDRQTGSSNVDERTLREIYLPAFAAATKNAWSAMCAYNKVNGQFACENFPLLNDVLKDQWGFDGAVGSDYPATKSGVRSALAGLDQEFGGTNHFAELAPAVRDGRLARAVLDDHARRVLRMMFRAGSFDGEQLPAVDPAAHAAVVRRQAAAGTVLLKNDRNLLPLNAPRSIAVSGGYADTVHQGGGGSSKVTAYEAHKVKPVDALRAKYPGVNYSVGSPIPPTALPGTAITGLRADFYSGTTLSGTPLRTVSYPNGSAVDFKWGTNAPESGVPADGWSARWSGTFTAPGTGLYELATTSDDGSRLYVDGQLVVDNWGDHRPQTRRHRLTLQAGVPHQFQVEYYEAADEAELRLGWSTPVAHDPLVQEAAAAARNAEVAVVIVGDESTEGEDRASLDLPGSQDELIAAVTAANPNTIVVLETGGPVTMPWISSAHTLLEAWYPGEQGGNALVDVLSGAVEPSGRLPMTFPVNLASSPMRTPAQYPGTGGNYDYSERLQVGYRWYDASGTAPLFPFGHGLGYTTFSYSGLTVTPAAVSFDVRNTSSRTGSAVPQVYVGYPEAAGEPPRQLRGFSKVSLAPGESRRVSVELDREAFAIWDTEDRAFRVPGGEYTISVGSSSRDVRLTGTVAQQASRIPNGATGEIVSDSQCLDVADANDAPGTPVHLWTCNGTGAQRWTAAPDGTIRALGRCLTLDGAGASVLGACTTRWDTSDGTLKIGARTFTMPRPADRITGLGGQCADVFGADPANGTPVALFGCNGSGAQDVKVAADGTLRALGKCLEAKDGLVEPGTPIQLWQCNGTPAQKWRVQGSTFINVKSGRCLEPKDGKATDLTPLQLWDCNGTAAQNWRIPVR